MIFDPSIRCIGLLERACETLDRIEAKTARDDAVREYVVLYTARRTHDLDGIIDLQEVGGYRESCRDQKLLGGPRCVHEMYFRIPARTAADAIVQAELLFRQHVARVSYGADRNAILPGFHLRSVGPA